MSTDWNWSWINSKEDTEKSSESIIDSSGTVYVFRQARNGQVDADDLNAAFNSVSQNIHALWGTWTTHTRPILDSLPAGGRDQRWSTTNGKGLPDKIDALQYGVQGSTVFVFNDANAVKADGRYWHSTDQRPKTIAEVLEDLNTRISTLTGVSTGNGGLTDQEVEDLWSAVGHRYKDSQLTSLSTSLDARAGVLETYINQMNEDVYGVSEFGGGLGTPLSYTIAKNLDELLKLHNVAGGWQADPAGIDHSGVDPGEHDHEYDEILSTLGASDQGARGSGTDRLDKDIKRLRWEIARTRGSANWQTDATCPIAGESYASLQLHVNHLGAGTPTTNNPHGITYTDTGANTIFANVRAFTGMDSNLDTTPDYSSTDFVTQGASLETAIGELDDAISTYIGSGTVIRADYQFDRSEQSQTERENAPILIEHNVGRKPIVEVLDVSPTEMTYYGEYVSPAIDLNIVHVDNNSFEIWTGAAVIEVIAMY